MATVNEGRGSRGGASSTGPALELDRVSRTYGSLRALADVTFSVRPGARHAVIGPNGAGKSTLFGIIAGTVPASGGRVVVGGRDVTRMPQYRRARLGVAQTFQHSSLFLPLSAAQNVRLAAQRALGSGGRPWRREHRDPAVEARVETSLHAAGLADRGAATVAAMSHGERRQLEIAMALAVQPRLLLLDEPTAGMSTAETRRFTALVESLPADVTVLLIEHDLDVVFRLATAVTVLHIGAVLADGTPEEIRDSPEVQEAYLGVADTSELFLAPGTGSP